MNIAHLLKKENIFYLSLVENKWELLKILVDKLVDSSKNEHFSAELKNSLLENVVAREKQSCTAMGSGIAFPHGRVSGLNQPLLALAIIKDGLDFNAPDKIPTKLVFLFLFPENRYELGVKIEAVFARFLMTNNHIEKIMGAANPDVIYNLIKEADLVIDTPIIAQDLMRNVRIKFSPDMLLNDATTRMHDFNTEVAAVVDNDGQLIGELDCIHLFQIELPDYIKTLHSVPPIHDFNPFSKYFANDRELTVKDVMNKEFAIVSKDASLLEIIFLLAVKNHFVIHVCEAGKLIGFIDRITVLDKVFNL